MFNRIKKSRKGQIIFVGMMLCILLFISGLMLLKPLLDASEQAQSDLTCDDSSISIFDKATCVLVDMMPFYLFGISMAVAIGSISIKKITNN